MKKMGLKQIQVDQPFSKSEKKNQKEIKEKIHNKKQLEYEYITYIQRKKRKRK